MDLKERSSRLIEELIRDHFPELKNTRVRVRVMREKGAFAYIVDLPLLNRTIHVHRRFRKVKDDEVLKGCLAHELEELCHSIKQSWWSQLTTVFRPKFETEHERMIDQRVIDRGCGPYLYKFIKYHDKYYEKYNKSDGLTAKEIKKQLKRWE